MGGNLMRWSVNMSKYFRKCHWVTMAISSSDLLMDLQDLFLKLPFTSLRKKNLAMKEINKNREFYILYIYKRNIFQHWALLLNKTMSWHFRKPSPFMIFQIVFRLQSLSLPLSFTEASSFSSLETLPHFMFGCTQRAFLVLFFVPYGLLYSRF